MITVDFNRIHVETDIALGNHMFQYAICRITALKNGYNFFIPDPGRLHNCFPEIDLGINDGEIKNHYADSQNQQYNPEVFDSPDYTNICGYFQSDKYFQGYENLIKEWFKIEMDDNVKKVLENYPPVDYCYINIRGSNNKGSYIMLPKSYYEKSMDQVKKINPNIKFVIITDDYEISKLYFPEIDVLSDEAMTDFKSLYYSKYAIISNSTFAWWSCWLSDKIVTIAPKFWYNYNKDPQGNVWFPADIRTNKFTYIANE
jgi:hypothetical protein